MARRTRLIGRMVTNLAGPEVTRYDPFYLNKLWGWVADTLFVGLAPGLTDVLVFTLELVIGLSLIAGVGMLWAAIAATFLNLQFFAAGSFNNFGYIATNLPFGGLHRMSGAIGLDGILRARRGQEVA